MRDLKKALREVCEPELDAAIAEAQKQDDHQFSSGHTAKMKKCIARRNHPISRFFAGTGVRAACIILVCITLSISALQVEAIWKPIKGFLLEKLTDGNSLSYYEDEKSLSAISDYYVLTALPNGYESQYMERTSAYALNFYQNESETIIFAQYVKSFYRDAQVDEESTVSNYTDPDGQAYFVIESQQCTTYLWDNGEYILHLNVPSSFTKEEAITLCKSAKCKKTE